MAQAGGGSVDHGREPCPDRVLDDIGGAFGMGAVGGGIWHLIKGTKNSPSGARMRGGIEVCICSQHSNQKSQDLVQEVQPGVVLIITSQKIMLCLHVSIDNALQAIRREAPRIGGSFAVWGGLFSSFDCTLVALRKKVQFHICRPQKLLLKPVTVPKQLPGCCNTSSWQHCVICRKIHGIL